MTVSPGRASLLATVTEAEWRAQVIRWARNRDWRVYAIHDSRKQVWGTAPGFPDLFLVRDAQAWAVELKSERGRVTEEQQTWLDALGYAGVSVDVWRPSQEALVKAVLT